MWGSQTPRASGPIIPKRYSEYGGVHTCGCFSKEEIHSFCHILKGIHDLKEMERKKEGTSMSDAILPSISISLAPSLPGPGCGMNNRHSLCALEEQG